MSAGQALGAKDSENHLPSSPPMPIFPLGKRFSAGMSIRVPAIRLTVQEKCK